VSESAGYRRDGLMDINRCSEVSFFRTSQTSVANRPANVYKTEIAGVAELADALDLGSCARKGVGVRLPPSAVDVLKNPAVCAAGFLSFSGQGQHAGPAPDRGSADGNVAHL
jgi:hypothetical protein